MKLQLKMKVYLCWFAYQELSPVMDLYGILKVIADSQRTMRLWIRPEYLAQYAAPIETRSYGTMTKENIARLMNYFGSGTIKCG